MCRTVALSPRPSTPLVPHKSKDSTPVPSTSSPAYTRSTHCLISPRFYLPSVPCSFQGAPCALWSWMVPVVGRFLEPSGTILYLDLSRSGSGPRTEGTTHLCLRESGVKRLETLVLRIASHPSKPTTDSSSCSPRRFPKPTQSRNLPALSWCFCHTHLVRRSLLSTPPPQCNSGSWPRTASTGALLWD